MTAPRISAKLNENMDIITFQALVNISGNIKFPESLQPWPHITHTATHLHNRYQSTVVFSLMASPMATSELHVGLELERRLTELISYVAMCNVVAQFLEQYNRSLGLIYLTV